MATSAHYVYSNFVWRLETLTPTGTVGNLRSRFVSYDPLRDDAAAMPSSRNFTVSWTGSAIDESPTDLYDRVAEHSYEIEIHYDPTLKWQTLQEIILQDRHDISKRLRDPAYFVGYDASHSSTEIYLKNRIRTGDSLVRDATLVTLRQQYRCMIWETE